MLGPQILTSVHVTEWDGGILPEGCNFARDRWSHALYSACAWSDSLCTSSIFSLQWTPLPSVILRLRGFEGMHQFFGHYKTLLLAALSLKNCRWPWARHNWRPNHPVCSHVCMCAHSYMHNLTWSLDVKQNYIHMLIKHKRNNIHEANVDFSKM